MSFQGRRASAELDRLRGEIADLEAYADLLKGALMAADIEPPPRHFYTLRTINHQQRTLIGLLLQAWPEAVAAIDLLERLPSREHVDGLDRNLKLVNVLVHYTRQRLGPDCIETVWGRGYKIGSAFRAELLTPTSRLSHRFMALPA